MRKFYFPDVNFVQHSHYGVAHQRNNQCGENVYQDNREKIEKNKHKSQKWQPDIPSFNVGHAIFL
jgi:hypothetical protein